MGRGWTVSGIVGGEKGSECRDCKRRVFDTPGGSRLDDVKRGAGNLGGRGRLDQRLTS
jgi:hypothetical protein